MKLSTALQGFILSITADRYSYRTIEEYQAHLTRLKIYLGDPELETVTVLDLQKYFAYLVTDYKPRRFNQDAKPLAGSSLNKIWISVRSFFRWCLAASLLNTNPAQTIKQPKYTTRAITPLSQAEIASLLKTTKSARTQTLILLLLDTGLRVGEATRLLIRDVNLETGEVNVIAFGSGRKTKSRTVFLGKAARRGVWRYLSERGDPDPSAPLLVSHQNQPMTRNAALCLLKKLGKRAGVVGCHPHRFRHTFAIQYLRNGGDVFTLQRLLGHSSLEMVKHYLALANADDALAHQSASPVDRWQL